MSDTETVPTEAFEEAKRDLRVTIEETAQWIMQEHPEWWETATYAASARKGAWLLARERAKMQVVQDAVAESPRVTGPVEPHQ